jgi:uncharacterized membrane protein YbjE (DUF340 family)
MQLILFSLLLGLLVGFSSLTPRWVHRSSRRLTSAGLVVLLFCMGASLGGNPQIIAQVRWIGWSALCHATLSITGSVLAAWGLERCWRGARTNVSTRR